MSPKVQQKVTELVEAIQEDILRRLTGAMLPQVAPARAAAPPPRREPARRVTPGDYVELRPRILSLVAANPGGLTATDLGRALRLKPATIASTLRRLRREGELRTEGARNGTRYMLPVSSAVPFAIRDLTRDAAATS